MADFPIDKKGNPEPSHVWWRKRHSLGADTDMFTTMFEEVWEVHRTPAWIKGKVKAARAATKLRPAGRSDPLQDATDVVVAWWLNPKGPPPAVTVEAEWLLPEGKLRYKSAPYKWPAQLASKQLVIVSASGGIDSTAAALLARSKWPGALFLLLRSDTGFEPKDSHGILRRLARKIRAPIITLKPRQTLFDLIRWFRRLPNKKWGDWCTENLKGQNLDWMGHYLTLRRRPGTTLQVAGILWGEGPERGPGKKDRTKHIEHTKERFGDQMEARLVLHEDEIGKKGAVKLIRKARLPISAVYLDRGRHGCIPCRWWDERLWRDFYRLDPEGFKLAAAVEDEIQGDAKSPSYLRRVEIEKRARRTEEKKQAAAAERRRRRKARGLLPIKRNSPDPRKPVDVVWEPAGLNMKTWIFPSKGDREQPVLMDRGLPYRTLRQWVEVWKARRQLGPKLEFPALMRVDDLQDLKECAGEPPREFQLVQLHRRGQRRRRSRS
jgi:hypothetical protein